MKAQNGRETRQYHIFCMKREPYHPAGPGDSEDFAFSLRDLS